MTSIPYNQSPPNQSRLHLTLYSGMALIVISMLFLMREQQSASFFVQALLTLAVPACFYGVGALVYRHLNAPLAAPGIVATGAWLIVVDLIHLYEQRVLLPHGLQSYYWLIASVLGMALITLTGHKIRTWLVVPLVPVTQINALWILLGTFGIGLARLPIWTFALVLVWAHLRLRDDRWTTIYRVCAMLLSVGMIVMSVTLPYSTPQTMFMTCMLGAIVIIYLGIREQFGVFVHLGLWVLAAAWALLHGLSFPSGDFTFGLWMALLAVGALLVERILASTRQQKNKPLSMVSTLTQWPIADLSLGLSVLILIWVVQALPVAPPMILATTTAVVIGIWLVAGVTYRLPILLHVALWMLPLPYMLFVMYLFPGARLLPVIGFTWQILGLGYVLLGHSLYRLRPAVRFPFFSTGYSLLNLPLLLTLYRPDLLPASLGLPVLVSLLTGAAVITDRHVAWSETIARFVDPHERAYRYKVINNVFLLHGAWLGAVWLNLMLEYTRLTFPQRGIAMVLISAVVITIGRILPRFPRAVGYPVYTAGWVLWLMGLVYVFPFPTEALITVILGLAVSAEAIYRSKEIYWLPAFLLQLLFTVLQITTIFVLPTELVLLIVTLTIAVMGMYTNHTKAGQIAEWLGTTLLLAAWLASFEHVDLMPTLSLIVLFAVLLLRYRRWEYLLPFYGLGILELYRWHIDLHPYWGGLLGAGILQIGVAVVLIRWLRPNVERTIEQAFSLELDWVTPFLWSGCISLIAASAALPAYSSTYENYTHWITYWLGVTVALSMMVIGLRLKQGRWLPLLTGWMVWYYLVTRISSASWEKSGGIINSPQAFIDHLMLEFGLGYFPLGILGLMVARWWDVYRGHLLEMFSTLLIILTMLIMPRLSDADLWGGVYGAVCAAGLMTYGWLGKRRIPFAISGLMIIGGLSLGIISISLWVLPLLLGIGILGMGLSMEIARETVNTWRAKWSRIWGTLR